MAIRLADRKSKINSQHGEDGVIAAIFEAIGVKSQTCVEFGAYDLTCFSNVYPLWTKGWRSILIEGNSQRYAKLVADFAAHPGAASLPVLLINRYVDESGPNSLDNVLAEAGFPFDPDLVSIDIDGTDYHVWRGLTRFRPRVVMVEYNPTIPHHIDLIGAAAGNDIGCSALSLHRLGNDKGYSLVACVGWNAVFVERQHAGMFTDADNLDALFDSTYVRYAMQSYNGQVFFDARLLIEYRPFLNDSDLIESSSVTVGKLGDTVRFFTKQTAWQYARMVKHRLLGGPYRRGDVWAWWALLAGMQC